MSHITSTLRTRIAAFDAVRWCIVGFAALEIVPTVFFASRVMAGDFPAVPYFVLLLAPAVVGGVLSGARYLSYFRGFSATARAHDDLSSGQAAAGRTTNARIFGDLGWGAVAAAAAAVVALPVVLVVQPWFFGVMLFYPVIPAIGWLAGWVAGVLVGVFGGAAIGLLRQARVSKDPLWLAVGLLMLLLVPAVVMPPFAMDPSGADSIWGSMLVLLGIPLEGYIIAAPPLYVFAARAVLILAVLAFSGSIVAAVVRGRRPWSRRG